jgi:hypothetical protein
MDLTELMFNKKDGNVVAAGYLIDSKMLKNGEPAAVIRGGGVSNLMDALKLGELAVPAGLFYLQDLAKKSVNTFNTSVFELYDDDDSSPVKLVETSLYDKLLAMVDGEEAPTKKAKMTRKKRGTVNKKTRRN